MADKNPSSRTYTPQGGLNAAFNRDVLPVAAPTTNTWGEAITRLIPGLSDAWGFSDAKDQYQQGNTKTAAATGALSAVGMGGLAKLLPAGIFVGRNGAFRAALEGNQAIDASQRMAKQLQIEAMGQHGANTWRDVPLPIRHATDKSIWQQTHAKTGYPSSVNFPDGQVQTEINDSLVHVTPEQLANYPDPSSSIIKKGPLGNFLPHVEAGFMYPELMQQPMFIRKASSMPQNVLASRSSSAMNPSYELSDRALSNRDDMRNFTLHELQHAIDDAEGMGSGANVAYFSHLLADIKPKRDSYLNTMAQMRDAGVSYDSPQWKSVERAMREEVEPTYRKVGSWDPDSAYTRTAGEAKARLVEARSDLPMSERARIYPLDLPNDTVGDDFKRVMDIPALIQWVRKGNMELRDKWQAHPNALDTPFIRQRHGAYRHENDVGAWRGSGWEDEPTKWKDGGYVDHLISQITPEQAADMLIDLHPDAPERFANGGLVLDAGQGLLSNKGMDIIHPTTNNKAPLDIPMNSNNMLATHRAGTPQAQLYRTK